MRRRGFTLIELMIVVFIITLMSVLVLANYRNGQRHYVLSQAAQRLASDLRRAQNMALGGVDLRMVYCGYGIKTDPANPDFYLFYADANNSGCASSNNKYDLLNDVVYEKISLPSGVTIGSFSSVDVFFKTPSPTTYINGNDAFDLEDLIKLEADGGAVPAKYIRVNTSGLIQIE